MWIAPVSLKANIGQDEDFKAAREKAQMLGAKKASSQSRLSESKKKNQNIY